MPLRSKRLGEPAGGRWRAHWLRSRFGGAHAGLNLAQCRLGRLQLVLRFVARLGIYHLLGREIDDPLVLRTPAFRVRRDAGPPGFGLFAKKAVGSYAPERAAADETALGPTAVLQQVAQIDQGVTSTTFHVPRAADVPSDSISYVEAHGTGTPVGDQFAALLGTFSLRPSGYLALAAQAVLIAAITAWASRRTLFATLDDIE